MIDPTAGSDYSQAQRIGGPLQGPAEKVSEVKEPRKAERSPDARLNTRKDRKGGQPRDRKKGFSLYV